MTRTTTAVSSIDLSHEPVPQAGSGGIVPTCSPWIRETPINGSGWR